MAFGTQEILLIAGACILLFGAPKVVDWARSLGKAKAEFKKAEIDALNVK